jgi:arsenite methyltransferase
MGFRDRFQAGVARQLGRPEGLRGRMIARELNRANRHVVAAAVAATGLQPGQVGADVGFGGGVGLGLLLERVGPAGHVHGVEVSDTMLAAAQRRHGDQVTSRRMTLQAGRLEELPLADGQVDGLITVNTIYFVDDLTAVFAEAARVLSADGRAVFGVADPEWMATMPVTAHVFRLRPLTELVDGLRTAGLVVRDELLEDDRRRFHLLIATPEGG